MWRHRLAVGVGFLLFGGIALAISEEPAKAPSPEPAQGAPASAPIRESAPPAHEVAHGTETAKSEVPHGEPVRAPEPARPSVARAVESVGGVTGISMDTNVMAQMTAANSPEGKTNEVVDEATLQKYRDKLAEARNLITTRQFALAEEKLLKLLDEKVPDTIRKPALLEMGGAVAAENDLPRAQSIYTQYLDRWSSDVRIPEVLLRQGEVFLQMGLEGMALAKFYGVMTAALSLKSDHMDYYRELVLQSQLKIAETYYQMGRYGDAADFYSRLLKQTESVVNRPLIQFRIVHSLSVIGHYDEAAAAAQDFLTHYPTDPQAPETRYYLAQALKGQGQAGESLRQVLAFLQEEKIQSRDHPEVWAYWQQRVGNEIANSFYKEGDYMKALGIYLSLVKLDAAPAWQLPIQYQIGITYEHLLQPQKAMEIYGKILATEKAVGTNTTPTLSAVFEMAHWRNGFIQWQGKARAVNQVLAESVSGSNASATNATAIQ